MIRPCSASIILIALVAPAATRGEGFTLDDSSLLLQPEAVASGAATPAEGPGEEGSVEDGGVNQAFGVEGHRAWSLHFGVAVVHDSTDANVTFNLHQFLADDFEFLLSFGGWHFDQEDGDNAIGASVSIGFRYHAFKDEARDWTTYFDFGIGVLGATDEVPDEGTAFNFVPRAGIGATFRLGDGPERLDVGVRWQHISNATIMGSDDNPARDALMLYAGIMVPF